MFNPTTCENQTFPFIVLNIGGVSNVTWINSNNLLAFDTGPGNSIIDDWVRFSLGIQYDDSGNLAKKGRSITKLVQELFIKSIDLANFSL